MQGSELMLNLKSNNYPKYSW